MICNVKQSGKEWGHACIDGRISEISEITIYHLWSLA
jgi:hypothetical protein